MSGRQPKLWNDMTHVERLTYSRRRYKNALNKFREAERLKDDVYLQATLAATILAGSSDMTPQDAVELAYLIVDNISTQRAQIVSLEMQRLQKAKVQK